MSGREYTTARVIPLHDLNQGTLFLGDKAERKRKVNGAGKEMQAGDERQKAVVPASGKGPRQTSGIHPGGLSTPPGASVCQSPGRLGSSG